MFWWITCKNSCRFAALYELISVETRARHYSKGCKNSARGTFFKAPLDIACWFGTKETYLVCAIKVIFYANRSSFLAPRSPVPLIAKVVAAEELRKIKCSKLTWEIIQVSPGKYLFFFLFFPSRSFCSRSEDSEKSLFVLCMSRPRYKRGEKAGRSSCRKENNDNDMKFRYLPALPATN